MLVTDEPVLLEFERIFGQWLLIREALDEDLRALFADSEAQSPDLCFIKAQKALVDALREPSKSRGSRTQMDEANLQKMRFALAAYWDDFLLQRHNWIDLPEVRQQSLRKAWLSCLVEWEAFGTRSAGKRFPEAVRSLIFAERRETGDASLLAVYYRILWLGFGGQDEASRAQSTALMESIRLALAAIGNGSGYEKSKQPLGLMPPAGMKVSRLAPIKHWRKLIFLAFAGLASSSLIIWVGLVLRLTTDLAG
jgi:type VI protein secretion system component VasF